MEPIIKAGHVAPWLAFIVSGLDVEKSLRVTSLVVGIVLGLYTLFIKIKNRNKGKGDE